MRLCPVRAGAVGPPVNVMLKNSVSVKQIQELDRRAITRVGIPSLVLMENAGRSVALETLKLLKRGNRPQACVVCGLGNNAGDGFVAARYLLEAGVKTKVYLIGKSRRLKDDAKVNYHILRKLKHPVYETGAAGPLFLRDMAEADVVIDALFGVGLNREVGEPFRAVIGAINRRANRVIATDIPSGLDGTTGKVYGACVRAHVTVTFSALKRGFLKGQGPAHVGKVIVTDIGIPKKLLMVPVTSGWA